MSVTVRIPTILRKHTGGEKAVPADGDTVEQTVLRAYQIGQGS